MAIRSFIVRLEFWPADGSSGNEAGDQQDSE